MLSAGSRAGVYPRFFSIWTRSGWELIGMEDGILKRCEGFSQSLFGGMFGSGGIAEPAIAVTTHTCHHLDQIMSLFGQRIFHARRHFGEGLTQNNSFLFQGAQTLRESLGADALQRTLQLIEAF